MFFHEIYIPGNLPLYTILRQGHYELRVDLMDWENNTAFAQYRHFTIGGPADLYMLMISGYFGNAGILKLHQVLGKSYLLRS